MYAERSRWLGLLLVLWWPAAWALAPIQHWQTANGARVYFEPAPELPMVDLRVVFDAGSARDDGRAGLALLTNTLLDKGAAGLSADAIAERLDGLGAQLDSGALRDMAWLGLRSLSDPARLDPAVALFAKLLSAPAFNPADVERERQRLIVAARQQEQDPGAVAERAFYQAVYGGHPYAGPPGGTVASLGGLTRDQVTAFHQRYYTARNAVVAIVGALDRKAAERLAEAAVAGLPAGQAAPALPPVPALKAARTERIHHASTQTHIWMGGPGVSRTDPDYFTLYVGNYVLGGGGLVSRLSEVIREQHGLSYSVYSYFFPMRVAGPFVMGLQTRNAKADEALGLLRSTLERYLADGPTAEELTAAKQNITGGYPLRIDTNRKVAEYLALIGFYGLPLDYLQTFNSKIEAVTAAQVKAAFDRRVHADRLVTVIVGGGAPAGAAE